MSVGYHGSSKMAVVAAAALLSPLQSPLLSQFCSLVRSRAVGRWADTFPARGVNSFLLSVPASTIHYKFL